MSENINGKLGVTYTELIPISLEAIKELKYENDILKSECYNNRLDIDKYKNI